jgi:bifunctional pyridoxal-dependent enzyme with beta-cystathionase and maltose regulon repressor activities
MIIINTPHNPVGKVFTKNELEVIAAIAEEFNLLVMADEVVSQSFSHYRKLSFFYPYLVRLSRIRWDGTCSHC